MQTADGVGVSEYVKFVKAAVVLKVDTPKRVCRLCSGYHQSIQEMVEGVGLPDVMHHIANLSLEKKKKTGNPYMTEPHLLMALMSCGITKSPVTRQSAEPGDVSAKGAMNSEANVVCNVHTLQALFCPVFFMFFSQRKNLLQYWRNYATWIGANCERKDRLIAKVQQLNEGSKSREAPVRVEPFRSKGGLIYSDYYDLGTFVLGLKGAKSDTISQKLEEMRFKRMVHYHVFGAPADRVHPLMSMPLF